VGGKRYLIAAGKAKGGRGEEETTHSVVVSI
jgi:hypothetical protein